jgi:hypothetical protein
MVPKDLAQRLRVQAASNPHVLRTQVQRRAAARALFDLKLSEADEIGEFYLEYSMNAIRSAADVNFVLVDICSPSDEVAKATEFVQRAYGVSEDYICLDIAEGESFVLYSRSTKLIFDAGRRDVPALNAGQARPTWNTFYELMDQYVS